MTRNRIFAISAGLSVLAVSSGLAMAATQGTLGSTSTGSVTITSTKGAAIQISGLSDFSFPPSATTPAPIEQTACIYSTTGSYTVLATSGHAAGGAFRLNNGGANYISYGVDWFASASGGTASSLSSGTQSSTQAGADTTSTSCGGGADSRIGITIDATSFTAAPTGTYTDTLTLLVAPV